MLFFKKKILVVEDDASLRKALVAKLKNEGYKVIETDTGSGVVGLIQTQKPALVILDLMLPGRDGMKILQLMRSDEWKNDTPVIVLTNLSGRGGLQDEAKSLNAKYFDKASTDINDILDAVKKTI